MSQEPVVVTYSLDEIFSRLEQKIDKLEQKIDGNQKEVNQKIDKLEQKIDGNQKEVNQKIDGNQKEVNQKIDKLEQKIDKQSEEITTIKATLQAQQPLVQKIPDLAEKVGELKNWRQIVIIALTALISGSITWVIRGGNFKP